MAKITINGNEIDTTGMSEAQINALKQTADGVKELQSTYNKTTTELDTLKKQSMPAPDPKGGLDMKEFAKMMNETFEAKLNEKFDSFNNAFQSNQSYMNKQKTQTAIADYKKQIGGAAFSKLEPIVNDIIEKVSNIEKFDYNKMTSQNINDEVMKSLRNSEDVNMKTLGSKLYLGETITDEFINTFTQETKPPGAEEVITEGGNASGTQGQQTEFEKNIESGNLDEADAVAAVMAGLEKL
jgi:hypothetical protein